MSAVVHHRGYAAARGHRHVAYAAVRAGHRSKRGAVDYIFMALFAICAIFSIVIVALAIKNGAPTAATEKALGRYGGVNDGKLVAVKSPGREFAEGARQRTGSGADRPINVTDFRGRKNLVADHIRTSAATIMADMGTEPVAVETPLGEKNPAGSSRIMQNVRAATKGDGQLRPVVVNGRQVADEYVKAAMFENQDFMPHDEAVLKAVPHLVDPTRRKQRSMFAPQRPNAGMALDRRPGAPEAMPYMSALDIQ
jgi:hypothetical protein